MHVAYSVTVKFYKFITIIIIIRYGRPYSIRRIMSRTWTYYTSTAYNLMNRPYLKIMNIPGSDSWALITLNLMCVALYQKGTCTIEFYKWLITVCSAQDGWLSWQCVGRGFTYLKKICLVFSLLNMSNRPS